MPLPRSTGLRYGRWCLLVALSAHAHAQPLTADEAVRIALDRNLDLQAERQRIAEAEAELAGARLRTPFNPIVGISTGPRNGPDGTSADVAFDAGQELEIGGQKKHRIAVAEAKLAQAMAESQTRGQEIATEVRRACAAVLLAREGLDYSRQLSVLAKDLMDVAQLRFEEGASTKLELNLAKTELGRARRDRLLTEQAASAALLDLRRLLGLKEDEPLAIRVDAPLPERLPLPAEALEQALARRPDVLARRREAEVAESESRLFRSLQTPNLDVGAEAAREGEESVVAVRVGIALPIFNRQQAEIQAAESRRRRAELAQQALRFQLEKDLLLAFNRYQSAREALALYREEVLPLFEENLELLNEAFKTGKVNFIQVLAVRKELLEQRQVYLESLGAAQDALIEWQLAAGTVLPAEPAADPDSKEK